MGVCIRGWNTGDDAGSDDTDSWKYDRKCSEWKGLEEEACYQDAESGELYYGAALMETGILLPIKSGAYQTFRILLRKVGS